MVSTGNIRYIAIGKREDNQVIASHTAYKLDGVDYPSLIEKVISASKFNDRSRLTITSGIGTIHYDTTANCAFFVVTAPSYPQRTAFSLLHELKDSFIARVGNNVADAQRNSLTSRCKPLLSSMAAKYDIIENVDRLEALKTETDAIKGIMHSNIDTLIRRGENLDELDDRANSLAVDARMFHTETQRVKRTMWVRNAKLWVVLLLVMFSLMTFLAISVLAPAAWLLWSRVIEPVYNEISGGQGWVGFGHAVAERLRG
ncbi:vesicle-associated membrane protein 7B [Carpediemonas membranifera]|uniref:Vesicle-associated membrane protein 7B n=1 Tax=Carpediemonas membranifera TaxID=201153 RepID=A0A8J6B1L0_9EUKA|nr:vesicle-associated membrane protein 7B [Carpediemonas membranifera]|eukprot:KAG9393738.1 vesicle-associated membrane protein 7B [Carpediemonas membranifera]